MQKVKPFDRTIIEIKCKFVKQKVKPFHILHLQKDIKKRGDNMRKRLNENQKRSNYIGIKVQSKTREQLNFISDRDKTPISTIIDQIIKQHIDNYFKIAKIDWDSLTDDEKRGGKEK